MQVKEVLRVKGNTLFTVTPDTHLSDCVVTMADHDVGSLVVMDKGALAGIVTFREVIRVLAKRQKEHRTGPTPPVAEIVVREVMNTEPTVATLDMEVDGRDVLLTAYSYGFNWYSYFERENARFLPVADLNMNGVVDDEDLGTVVENFGKCLLSVCK